MGRYKSYLWVISGEFNTFGTTKFCLAYQYCDCKDIKYSKGDRNTEAKLKLTRTKTNT